VEITYTLELDTAVDDVAAIADPTTALQETIKAIVKGTKNVDVTVVTEHGPAGGNPVVRYEGSFSDVTLVALRYHGLDTNVEAEVHDVLMCMTPVHTCVDPELERTLNGE